jgi:hypothetical protein
MEIETAAGGGRLTGPIIAKLPAKSHIKKWGKSLKSDLPGREGHSIINKLE